MANEVTFQVYTPGSDIAIGFRPTQLLWARSGNDVLLGYQPLTLDPGHFQLDILLGDLAIDDPAARQWSDTFILGDWTRPYYVNAELTDNSSVFDLTEIFSTLTSYVVAGFDGVLDSAPTSNYLGLRDVALIADFTPGLDSLQLYGTADNYQLLETPLGTLVLYERGNQFDAVALLVGVTGLNVNDSSFDYRGFAPPSGPVLPQIQQFGTTEYDIPLGITVDSSGNVFVAGGTNSSLAGPINGLRDNFVTKYDSQGNVQFSQQFGTAGFETIYGIETDNQGNYYVTGVTDGELGGPRQTDALDTFVAKFDSEGNQVWLRQIGQNIIFNAFNLAVDKVTGDVFISGADVDDSSGDNTFVIKFDTNGNQEWFTETGTSGLLSFDESYGLTVSNNGSVYAAGWTSGNLGGPNQGLYDNWIAKYDNTTGATEWIIQYGTSDYEWAWDVRTDSTENVYTAGWTLGNLGGTNAGSYDAYLTKFDDQGNLIWVEQFGSAGDDEAYSLYIDGSDNLYVAGYTDGDLGGTNAGSYDAWVAKYDTNGNQIWITQFGTSDRDELYGIVADDSGNLYATGITQGSLGALNAGSFDGWTAKLDAFTGELQNFSGENTGDEILRGTRAAEVINGQDGNDQIFGNGGTDTLLGGTGDDLIYGGSKADHIFGGSGDDTIYGKGGRDVIDSGSGFDRIHLTGGRATVTLNQGFGHDFIKNFQLGATKLKVSGLDDLSFVGSKGNVKIFEDNDLLAVVDCASVNTFKRHAEKIFVV
ncbi:SBBP repeat-containing protein [Leptolyngbya sp. FACHB-16]|uniref:SBBP repeat-containing protein n=1 Tax=unclassified Leptolyngbya TaxID=2650499 RepID=UPI0016831019|nr:SBBP repeat-containing protein [Leptolyngbya sp. FACHB-16]MBD2156993.1 SBBP repeat-containing protein [Leptolyngbya sp. FACHB-16]